ncbi:MAG: hypothetical protein R3212_02380 [Xanthomonadales bacterium]|nr:hypothetical protein [Xanthomonadales bacterium]
MDLTISDGVQSQNVEFHTSCSEPLAIGDVFGSMILVDIEADLTPGMEHALYDLTLGAVGPEGPQGPQGKQGDQGDQGPQGKQGDQGDQGPQGKQGDQGDQGPQGKQGDQGDQGPQGKQGDQGDQGPQGKQGDTGAQGPQGKQGDTGAQGPQGKQGDTGATGPQGPQGKQGNTGATGPQGPQGKQGPPGQDGGTGSNLLCFATDQTIGTSGKFIGIGQQAGDFDSVSVVLPFASGNVTTFVAKAAQGNSPRSGTARLFHEDPNSENIEMIAECDLPATPIDSVCFDNSGAAVGNVQADPDSLALFIETDGGSFEGGSACVLISNPQPLSPPGPQTTVLPQGRLD